MRALAFAGTASLRPDDTVLVAYTRVRPLLQFHDHQVRRVILVTTGQQQIDALRALWDLVLDAHAHVVRQPRGAQHLGHFTQRLTPGTLLTLPGVATGGLQECVGDAFLDPAVGMPKELRLRAAVDNHP